MRFLLAALAILLALPSAAFAQAIGDTSPFTMSATPQYPAPYNAVTLSFVSTSLNLANSTLTVSANGTKLYQGSVHPVSVQLGAAGSVTTVTATISTNGTAQTEKLSLVPQDVALVTEPISSAPPLYLGKPSVPLEGDSRVVAVANLRDAKGKPLDPSTLSYAWTVDNTQISDSSGIGKTSILVASPMRYRNRTVSVAVTSQDGSLASGASVALVPLEPTMRIYENNLLLGIRYDRALSGSFSITDSESSLYAAAFSFPTTNSAPVLHWFLNGNSAQSGNLITLRPTGSGQGNASLSVTASSGSFTTVNQALSIQFGTSGTGSNLFGL